MNISAKKTKLVEIPEVVNGKWMAEVRTFTYLGIDLYSKRQAMMKK